jgi:cytidyltransferase-like protein
MIEINILYYLIIQTMSLKSNKKVVITSGYFNPLHIGHINLIREAKNLGDFLVVIVNNDKQVKIKGSVPFMPGQERIEIIKSLRYADDVILSVDDDKSVIKSLEMIAKNYPKQQLIFAKGGDRNIDNIPEREVCQKLGIDIVSGVGGDKIQSSSALLKGVGNSAP